MALLVSSVAAYLGCSSSDKRAADAGASAAEETAEAPAAEDAAEDKPFVLADLVEPFTPPTLEELDKTAEWQDRPVPETLLSGHHGKIAAWRLRQSEDVTRARRPDLWARYAAAPGKEKEGMKR